MSAEANDLLIRICRAARVLLDRIRQEAQGALAALDPDPGAPPPFAGRLLGRLRPPDVTDPAAAALVRAVTAALPTGPSPDGAELRLVGLVSPDGTGRGPALLAVGPGAPGPMLALGATDAGIELLAAGTGGAAVVVPLGRGLELELTVGAAANTDVLFPPGGDPPRILAGDAAAQIRRHLRRVPGAPALTLGPQAGPHALVGDLGLDVSMTGSAVAVRLTLPNLTVSVAPDVVAAVLGDAVRVRADVLLTANPEGIGLGAGQRMRTQLPARVDVPLADVDAVQLALSPRPAAGATAGLTVAVIVGFRLSLAPPMLPLRFAADGLGVTFPLALGEGTRPGVGLDSGAVVPAEASGLNAGLRLPPVSGSGYLRRRQAQHRARDDAWQRAAATAERVDATLAGLAVDSRQRPPQRPQLSGARGENVLNAAYLVDAGRTEAFAALARRLDAEAPGTRIELTGPWAPYSFALPDDEEPA